MTTTIPTEPQPLSEEQRVAIVDCIGWYNAKVYPKPGRVDNNPAELVEVPGGYIVRCTKSQHVYRPSAWLHFAYDMLRRALGDTAAAQRVDDYRATMKLLRSSK